jgi:hypothetical protein
MHKGDVWSFDTVPEIEITDPSLFDWWTFDEGRGTTVVDWFGHGHHGRIEVEGDPLWVDGHQIAAIDMAGVTSVHIPAESWSTIQNQATDLTNVGTITLGFGTSTILAVTTKGFL